MVNLKTYFGGGTKLPKTISTSRYSCVFFTWKRFIKSALIYKRSGKQKKTHQSKSFKFFHRSSGPLISCKNKKAKKVESSAFPQYLSWNKNMPKTRYLILEHGIVRDFKFSPGVCLYWHFSLENNAWAKPDITRNLKAIELNYTRDGLKPAKEARYLFINQNTNKKGKRQALSVRYYFSESPQRFLPFWIRVPIRSLGLWGLF